jgi:hypothetical protein
MQHNIPYLLVVCYGGHEHDPTTSAISADERLPRCWAALRPELAFEIEVAPYPYENKKTVFSGTPLPRLQESEKAGLSNSEHFFHL